jgi:hypothetical protein
VVEVRREAGAGVRDVQAVAGRRPLAVLDEIGEPFLLCRRLAPGEPPNRSLEVPAICSRPSWPGCGSRAAVEAAGPAGCRGDPRRWLSPGRRRYRSGGRNRRRVRCRSRAPHAQQGVLGDRRIDGPVATTPNAKRAPIASAIVAREHKPPQHPVSTRSLRLHGRKGRHRSSAPGRRAHASVTRCRPLSQFPQSATAQVGRSAAVASMRARWRGRNGGVGVGEPTRSERRASLVSVVVAAGGDRQAKEGAERAEKGQVRVFVGGAPLWARRAQIECCRPAFTSVRRSPSLRTRGRPSRARLRLVRSARPAPSSRRRRNRLARVRRPRWKYAPRSKHRGSSVDPTRSSLRGYSARSSRGHRRPFPTLRTPFRKTDAVAGGSQPTTGCGSP